MKEALRPPVYDLLIRGGRVIDPASGLDSYGDVAVRHGRVAALSQTSLDPAGARQVIDAEGLVVTPGLVDIHTHVYSTKEPGGLSVVADDHTFASGVTTVVDTGTSGARHFAHFKQSVIDRSQTRILALVNIVASGMIGPWEQDPAEMNPEQAAEAVLSYPDCCVGIKTAHYRMDEPFDAEHPPWAAVDRALEAGRLCNRPVMFDFHPRLERPYEELLRRMRPGDIHTHVYARHFPLLTADGRVQPFYREARDRGVRFDLGHGLSSFVFDHAVPAVHDEFLPDAISTDLHSGSVNGPALSMAAVLSKMMAVGVDLSTAIDLSTRRPADLIGRPELGRLSVGSEADIALFRVDHGEFGFVDSAGLAMPASCRLRCVLTLRSGKIVYNPEGLGRPLWTGPDPHGPQGSRSSVPRYADLGVGTIVNAFATVTRIGGSLPAPEVVAAMAEAARHYVDIDELQAAAGKRIAELTHNEAAYITTGAAAGILLATTAAAFGTDVSGAIRLSLGLPEAEPRPEVVVQAIHRNCFDMAIEQLGVPIVEAGTGDGASADDVRRAIGPKTVALWWFQGVMNRPTELTFDECVTIAHEAGVPVLVDAAAQLPPPENLWRYTQRGADAVVFSGGKDLRAPQSTGMILGRRDLIEACRAHANPNQGVGRAMKVGKEEIMGLLAAVERYLAIDQQERRHEFESTVRLWVDRLGAVDGLKACRDFPNEAGQPVARALVRFADRPTRDAVVRDLAAGAPSVRVAPAGEDGCYLNPMTLEVEEARYVADRLVDSLSRVHGGCPPRRLTSPAGGL